MLKKLLNLNPSKVWDAIKRVFQAAILWFTFQKGRTTERDKRELRDKQEALDIIAEDKRRENRVRDMSLDLRERFVKLYAPKSKD